MKLFILLVFFIPFTTFANQDQYFLTTNYYEGLGQMMRVESVVKYDQDCHEIRLAEVILVHEKNEIREIAMLNPKGEWIGYPKDNKAALKEITKLINQASAQKSSCLKNQLKQQEQILKEEQERKNIEELQLVEPPVPEILIEEKKTKEVLQ